MNERIQRENPKAVFEETLVSEAQRFLRGMGDSNFRKPTQGVVLEGARDYLGLNGDPSEAEPLVFMRAANKLLAERNIKGVEVGVSVTDQVVYLPNGEETRQSFWRPSLLRSSQEA